MASPEELMAEDRMKEISDELHDLRLHVASNPLNAWKIEKLLQERKQLMMDFIRVVK